MDEVLESADYKREESWFILEVIWTIFWIFCRIELGGWCEKWR